MLTMGEKVSMNQDSIEKSYIVYKSYWSEGGHR